MGRKPAPRRPRVATRRANPVRLKEHQHRNSASIADPVQPLPKTHSAVTGEGRVDTAKGVSTSSRDGWRRLERTQRTLPKSKHWIHLSPLVRFE